MRMYIFNWKKNVFSLVAVLVQDDNTASPEDFTEVMAEQKKTIVQFLVKRQEDNELFDAVNIGYARFLWHTWKIKTVKTLSTVKPKTNKNQNKVLSSVPRSLQIVKNQRKKRKILQDELPVNVLYRRK